MQLERNVKKRDNQENLKDMKANLGNKLLNAVISGIVLGSELVGLDEVLHIHIFDKDIDRNRAKGGHTCIWGYQLSLLQ